VDASPHRHRRAAAGAREGRSSSSARWLVARTPAPPRSCAQHKKARRAAGGRFSSPALAPRHMGQGGAELELPRPQLPQAVLDGRQPARRLHRGRARGTGRPAAPSFPPTADAQQCSTVMARG
jgi:hypothetical protein